MSNSGGTLHPKVKFLPRFHPRHKAHIPSDVHSREPFSLPSTQCARLGSVGWNWSVWRNMKIPHRQKTQSWNWTRNFVVLRRLWTHHQLCQHHGQSMAALSMVLKHSSGHWNWGERDALTHTHTHKSLNIFTKWLAFIIMLWKQQQKKKPQNNLFIIHQCQQT